LCFGFGNSCTKIGKFFLWFWNSCTKQAIFLLWFWNTCIIKQELFAFAFGTFAPNIASSFALELIAYDSEFSAVGL